MPNVFADFDFKNFWDNDEYALENYVSPHFDDEMLDYVESELGYKLPPSYIEFMRYQNGGTPKKNIFPIKIGNSNYSADIQVIYGIGETQDESLLGQYGSQFWIREWDYPNIGVYFADTLAGEHDKIAFDYSVCDETGEPQIVLIDQENEFKKYFVAKNFESFIKNLK